MLHVLSVLSSGSSFSNSNSNYNYENTNVSSHLCFFRSINLARTAKNKSLSRALVPANW
jgi:hypothetical protein